MANQGVSDTLNIPDDWPKTGCVSFSSLVKFIPFIMSPPAIIICTGWFE